MSAIPRVPVKIVPVVDLGGKQGFGDDNDPRWQWCEFNAYDRCTGTIACGSGPDVRHTADRKVARHKRPD